MRLLFFTHSLASGGAERATANLANHWASRGWAITILTMAAEADYYALHPSIDRISLDMATEGGSLFLGLWNNIRRVRMVKRLLGRIEPHIAIGVMSTGNILLALATLTSPNVATIGTERTYPPRMASNSMRGLARRWAYGQLDAVVALTEDSRTWLARNTTARRLAVIPNGLVWPLPVQNPVVKPNDFSGADRKVLLSVGRLEEVKGFDMLVDAFARIAAGHPDWDLVILGEGPERTAIEKQIHAARLEGRILLPGRAGNVGDWYSRAALYAASSRFEGFPNSQVEALAYGLPVVSFDCDTGPRDIIRPEIDGLLVPPNDPAALASALDRLMSDETLRRSLAARAPEARDRFSFDRVIAMWETLFEEIRPGQA